MPTNSSNLTPALDFVVLYVSDLQATSNYMVEKLGFTYLAESSGPNFHQLAGAEGSPGIGLLQASEQTPAPGMVQLYFKSEDLAGLRELIIGCGVEIEPIQKMPFGSIFDVPMPDGLLLTMLGWPEAGK